MVLFKGQGKHMLEVGGGGIGGTTVASKWWSNKTQEMMICGKKQEIVMGRGRCGDGTIFKGNWVFCSR